MLVKHSNRRNLWFYGRNIPGEIGFQKDDKFLEGKSTDELINSI